MKQRHPITQSDAATQAAALASNERFCREIGIECEPTIQPGIAPKTFACVNLDVNPDVNRAFARGAYIIEASTPSEALAKYLKGDATHAACRVNTYRCSADGAIHGKDIRRNDADTWYATA